MDDLDRKIVAAMERMEGATPVAMRADAERRNWKAEAIRDYFPLREFRRTDCAACGHALAHEDAQDLHLDAITPFADAEGVTFIGRCPACATAFDFHEGGTAVLWYVETRRVSPGAGRPRPENPHPCDIKVVRLFADPMQVHGRALFAVLASAAARKNGAVLQC